MTDVNLSLNARSPKESRRAGGTKGPIQGPGLTAPGVILLQSLIILLLETFEYAIGKIGFITGLGILLAVAAGVYLGRSGTEFVTAVNPPLAALFSTILVLCTLGGVGLHIARLGLDLVTALAALAPYLAVGALTSWGYFFFKARKFNGQFNGKSNKK